MPTAPHSMVQNTQILWSMWLQRKPFWHPEGNTYMTQFNNTICLFFFNQSGGGKELFVSKLGCLCKSCCICPWNRTYLRRAQQRVPHTLTSSIPHFCCLSWRIQLSAHPGSLKKTTLNDLVLHNQTPGATGKRKGKHCPSKLRQKGKATRLVFLPLF